MNNHFNSEHFNHFLDTAIERHKIYKLKEEGMPAPWTEDEIFQNFFFCNVFRQYDKCTKWLIENILPFERWDLIILYRFISTYSTFCRIKENCKLDNLSEVKDFLSSRKEEGEKLFSSCFIRNPRVPGGWLETYEAPFFLIESLKANDYIKEVIKENSMERLVDFLKQFPGVGGFMAYEYACDFEYTDYFNPTDKNTYANMGPGARQGMSLIRFGYPTVRIKQRDWLPDAVVVREVMEEEFRIYFPEEKITLREVEHWLCEYQKYVKYLNAYTGNQKVKFRKYNGR